MFLGISNVVPEDLSMNAVLRHVGQAMHEANDLVPPPKDLKQVLICRVVLDYVMDGTPSRRLLMTHHTDRCCKGSQQTPLVPAKWILNEMSLQSTTHV